MTDSEFIQHVEDSGMSVEELLDRCELDYEDLIDILSPVILRNRENFYEFEEVFH